MKIGLIGMPNSGKTTVFNTLTRGNAEVTSYAGSRTEPHLAVVEVADDRIGRLVALYTPQKTVYATVDFVDFAGLSGSSAQDGSFSGNAMALMRECDALALVLRNFSLAAMDNPAPLQELKQLEEELLLADLILVENRMERVVLQLAKGRKTHELEFEHKTLQALFSHLENALPLRDLDLKPDEKKLIRGFRFFTEKPFLVVLNSDESSFKKNNSLIEHIQSRYAVVEFAGKFEMELSRLDEKDASLFMQDMKIDAPARERLLHLAYKSLGYISFFTVGKDEVRAWSIQKNRTALDAANTIHSDLARGFIRAECMSYNDLITAGSEKAVREKGRLFLEGKNYVVSDGDILNIRFNV